MYFCIWMFSQLEVMLGPMSRIWAPAVSHERLHHTTMFALSTGPFSETVNPKPRVRV